MIVDVSDEVRAAMARRVAEVFQGLGYSLDTLATARRAVDALVSAGLGPRPDVEADALRERISDCSHACPLCPAGEEVWVVDPEEVLALVRELGITVVP